MTDCRRCGTANPPVARFCMTCGTGLCDGTAPAQELRFVTVVFCDVAGSTELAVQLDAEVWASVMEGYFTAVGGALRAAGGRLEKFIGDAVVGVFGIDGAEEGDALRAVTAAREALGRLAASSDRFGRHGVRLSARFGVASGRVAAADRDSSFAVGAVMNRAARLQSAAPAGGTVLDLTTWLLVRDDIACTEIETVAAKGFDQPLRAWRADAAAGAGAAPRTRFVNHERLRADIARRIRARLGAPGTWVALLTGEAGIGKTRLLHTLCEDLRLGLGFRVLTMSCPRDGDRLSLWPLHRLAEELSAAELTTGLPPEPAGPLAQTVEDLHWTLGRRLARLAADRPLVLGLDDFPRAGAPLRALVERLDAGEGRIVVLLTGRNAETPPIRAEYRTTVPALDEENARVLLDAVVADLDAPGLAGPGLAAHADEIVRRSQGNPLFLEQLTTLATDGIHEFVAPSAEAALGARIDRLSSGARRVLACAGAWRGEVGLADLAAACGVDQGAFDAATAELTGVGLLPVGGSPQRAGARAAADVAYARMLLVERARVHGRIAERLQAMAGHRPGAIEPAAVHAELAHSAWSRADPGSAAQRDAARRAASCLCSAARFTVSRSQVSRALELTARARPWCDDEALRLDMAAVESYALAASGRTGDALDLIGELAASAAAETNLLATAHLRINELMIRSTLGDWDDRLFALADDLIERADEDGGRARLLLVRGLHAARSGDYVHAERLLRSAHSLSRRVAVPFGTAEIHGNLALCLAYGDTPAAEARRRCTDLRADTARAPMLLAAVDCPTAFLHALTGDADTAVRLVDEAEDILAGIGHKAGAAGAQEFRGMVAELLDDEPGAVRALAAAGALYEEIGFEDAARRCRVRRILVTPAETPLPEDLHTECPGSWLDAVSALQVAALRESAAGDAGAAVRHLDDALRRLRRVRGHGAALLPLTRCVRVAEVLGTDARALRARETARRAVREALSAKS